MIEFDRKPETIKAIQWTAETTINELMDTLWKRGATDFIIGLGRNDNQGNLKIDMPSRNVTLYIEPNGYIVFYGGREIGTLTESELSDKYHNGRAIMQ